MQPSPYHDPSMVPKIQDLALLEILGRTLGLRNRESETCGDLLLPPSANGVIQERITSKMGMIVLFNDIRPS